MADYKFLDADGLQAVWSIIDAEKVGKKERRISDNAPLGEIFNTYSTNSWEANTASAAGSHAEGQHTTASGQAAHAQGIDTVASGIASHAGGQNTTASGNYAMTIGQGTEASSGGSLAMGVCTWTDSADGALALGKYNKKDVYNFLIAAGNGTGDQARSNAFTVYNNGNTEIAGTLTVTGVGTFSSDLSVTGTVTAGSISMMQSGIATPLSSIFVSQVAGKQLSTEDYTTAEKTKLSGIETGANKTTVDSALDASSTNPVQNKIVKENFDTLYEMIESKYQGQRATDINTTTEPGVYRFYGNNGTSNLPSDITVASPFGMLEVSAMDEYRKQVLTHFISAAPPVIYVRRSSDSGATWSPWGKFEGILVS